MDAVLEAVHAAPSGTSVDVASPGVDLLGFRIGGHRFLVSYVDAVEIEQVPELARAPAAPAWVAGLANLHGNVIGVLDLRPLLGESADGPQAAMPERQMILVLRHRRDRVALLIDGMTSRMTVGQVEPAAPATAAYGDCVVRAFRAEGRIWQELDYPKFFDDLNSRQVKLLGVTE